LKTRTAIVGAKGIKITLRNEVDRKKEEGGAGLPQRDQGKAWWKDMTDTKLGEIKEIHGLKKKNQKQREQRLGDWETPRGRQKTLTAERHRRDRYLRKIRRG